MMNLMYRMKYLARKGMLTVMGPAQLDGEKDPMNRLERERSEVLGARSTKTKEYPKKRTFQHS